jgi:hypothetical protein
VGEDRRFNHLSLDEILDLSRHRQQDAQDKPDAQPDAEAATNKKKDEVRLYTSEEIMWESITGHGFDLKRVPRSEWELLLGIASRTTDGILQGDLGRLAGQDKRSVPKRTDSLVKKGYIVKRTTLVRGTKTSKLWLRKFAPKIIQEIENKLEEGPTKDITLSRENLTSNLDPVPWHSRWTEETLDYRAFATTIMALVKQWGVMRVADLKAKLGILGSRPRMKVMAMTCRFLNARGIVLYVAARLDYKDSKVYKDCIKYARDMTSQDWAIYLATGKRGSALTRKMNAPEEDSQYLLASPAVLKSCRSWTTDEPLAHYILDAVRSFGQIGLTNPDIYSLTAGPAFTRYISALTSLLANAITQPRHLQHWKLMYEHTRNGKVASYRYLVKPQETEEQSSAASTTVYGFPAVSKSKGQKSVYSLERLCRLTTWKWPDRARKQGLVKLQKDEGQGNPNRSVAETNGETRLDAPAEERDDAGDLGLVPPSLEPVRTQEEEGEAQTEAQNETQKSVPPTRSRSSDEEIHDSIVVAVTRHSDSEEVDKEGESSRNDDSQEKPPVVVNADAGENGHQESDAAKEGELPEEAPEAAEASASGRGRGRGRGGGRSRGRGRARAKGGRGRASSGSNIKPWKCEKCGGAWKNDLGLKYHQSKARTTCNPNYDPTEARKPKKMVRELATTTIPAGSGTDDEAAEQQDSVKEKRRPSKASKTARAAARKVQMKEEPVDDNYSPKVSRPAQSKGPYGEGETVFSAPNTTVGLLLDDTQDQIMQPSLFFHRELKPSEPMEIDIEPAPFLQPPLAEAVPAEMDENIDPQLRAAHEDKLPVHESARENVVDASATPRDNSVVPSPKKPASKTQRNQRIEELTSQILAENNGVFPGGEPLWRSLTTAWIYHYPGEPHPITKDYQSGLRGLLQKKVFSEHWHAFRSETGAFAKCSIISWPYLDPFCAQAVDLLSHMKAAHPKLYYPNKAQLARQGAHFMAVDQPIRSRRPLPVDIQNLTAPVYVARLAQKKEQVAALDFRRDQRKRKKRRYSRDSADDDDTRNMRDGQGLRWVEVGFPVNDEPAVNFEAGPGLQFLDPNTYMEDEPPGFSADELAGTRRISKRGLKRRASEELVSEPWPEPVTREGFDIVPATALASSSTGDWPNLSGGFFENDMTSFTLIGWKPAPPSFAWTRFAQEIDKGQRKLMRTRRRLYPDESLSYSSFITRVQACFSAETAWASFFSSVSDTLASTNKNVFIYFPSSPVRDVVKYSAISWPQEGQLSLENPDKIPESPSETETSESEREVDVTKTPPPAPKVKRAKRQYPKEDKDPRKPAPLAARRLTELTTGTGDRSDVHAHLDNEEEVTAAIIAVRVLLGGTDKAIDWAVLLHIFPDIGLARMRKFWVTLRKSKGPLMAKYMSVFQDRFIPAYEADEVPTIDYNNLLGYDWHALIRWTMDVLGQEAAPIPPTVAELERRFEVMDVRTMVDDWRDRFFHNQTSTFARLAAAASEPGAAPLTSKQHTVTRVDVAKSWLRALCWTHHAQYTPKDIKTQLMTLYEDGDEKKTTALLEQAIDQLTEQRIMHRSIRPAMDKRPWRATDHFMTALYKNAQRSKYDEAAQFKHELDAAFRRRQTYTVSYTLDDGSTMALLNLVGHKRVKLLPTNVPYIPFGLEPLSYENRKIPKSRYHFGLEVTPTDTYLYNQDIDVLHAVSATDPPSEGEMREIPQWCDIFGAQDLERWRDVLGALCFAYSTRGQLTVEGVCNALKPVLEEFEAHMIINWGMRTGVLEESPLGQGVTIGEWWWLAVPWL